MAIGNYAELQTAVANWLDRSDLTARIPEFITLAEAEFSRKLRVPEMEARAVSTGVTSRVTLPTDVVQVKAVSVLTGNERRALENVALLGAVDTWGTLVGQATQYAISDGQLWFFPTPQGGIDVEIVYLRKVPALTSTATTNWLLNAHPDLYLFGALMQAEFYGWADNRLGLIKARADEIIEQINKQGRRANQGGALRMKLPHVV